MTSRSELFGLFSPDRRLKVFFDFPDLSVELVWEKGETKSREGRLVVNYLQRELVRVDPLLSGL